MSLIIDEIQNAPFHGVILSAVVTLCQGIYHNIKIIKYITESVLCASITLSMVCSLEFFSFPQSLSPAVGVCIGLLGFERVKKIIDFQLNKVLKQQSEKFLFNSSRHMNNKSNEK